MPVRYVLTEYVDRAMEQAVYEKLEDGSYCGRIPPCQGVIAFAESLRECEKGLQGVLEDWVLLGLKMRHSLPVLGDINLNREPGRVESV